MTVPTKMRNLTPAIHRLLLLGVLVALQGCGSLPSSEGCWNRCKDRYDRAYSDCSNYVRPIPSRKQGAKDTEFAKCMDDQRFPNGFNDCESECSK